MQFQQTVNFYVELQLHFGADMDYMDYQYSFGAGVVKLNKGIKVSKLFEDAVFNNPIWLLQPRRPVQQMQEF